jgi:hypothetical protein
MQRTIDRKYFQSIHKEVKHGIEYNVIKPKNAPMILFSKIDGSPLAAMHFISKTSRTLISRRPEKSKFDCDFQGLIVGDGQEFELVITNLCYEGQINFNIMKKNIGIQEVNPGGLNEVNELRSMESYAVKCDQSNNMTLVLNSIKNDKSEKVTIGESEKTATKEKGPDGTYYYLSVIPQIDKKEMVGRFKDTVWACVDTFVLQKPKQTVNLYTDDWFGASTEHVTVANRNLMNPMRPIGINTVGTRMTSGSHDIRGSISGSDLASPWITTTLDPDQVFKSNGPINCSSEIGGSGNDIQLDGSMAGSSPYVQYGGTPGVNDIAASAGPKQKVKEATDSESDDDMGFSLFDDDIPTPNNLLSNKATQQIIDDSYAATVGAGKQIAVNSAFTGIEYDYDSTSCQCIIGLSVSPDIQFRDTHNPDDLIVEGRASIQDIIKNKSMDMLDSINKVYVSNECVVCLEDTVDSVYYQCGHQCCHYECGKELTKCPMCRSCIVATIKI